MPTPSKRNTTNPHIPSLLNLIILSIVATPLDIPGLKILITVPENTQATSPIKPQTLSETLPSPTLDLSTQSILLDKNSSQSRHHHNKSHINHKECLKSRAFTRKKVKDQFTTIEHLTIKLRDSLILSQFQIQSTMSILSQFLQIGIQICMTPSEAMYNIKSQSLNPLIHTKVKPSKGTTKIIAILTKFLKKGELKISNPTVVNIQIHPLMIRPNSIRIQTICHLNPDFPNQESPNQSHRKSSSLP